MVCHMWSNFSNHQTHNQLHNHEHCMSCSQSWVVVRKLCHCFLPVVLPSLFSFGFLSHTLWYMGSILRSRSKRNPLGIPVRCILFVLPDHLHRLHLQIEPGP